MSREYSSTVRRDDWQYVLDHASLANTFHTPDYYDIQTSLGHTLLYSCCYEQGEPIGIMVGTMNTSGYHQGLIEVGTKSGGYPLMIDRFDQAPDAEQIKNAFIAHFAREYFTGQRFIMYPCFHLTHCVLEEPGWDCITQYDSTAFLDLRSDEETLWKGLQGKCRNAVRYAQRQGVTARIANELPYFDRFYHFYKEIRIKRDTQYISYEELRAKFEAFTHKGLADLWVSFLDDLPLAYAFIWKYRRTINFVYGSSDAESWSYKPNNLIQWELIRYYKQQGYTLYNMWGIRNMNFSEKAPPSDRKIEGYGKFKLSFGAELRDLVRYVRV
ncbi:peptidoglycan bridge formation glycyltransferase FemA/FemB family protein [candidate division KSB3 bacterium]|uniref:Peptidoglycan bridge formation glycyltransferase FemA/FemB family protein n=1 Tax=candidate division KSB3 bacterium TaxID=2044937 RepID=A0A9D5Q810_9BACT|nr:peptidoglycan bridge formation glycyltransferase FemA/FemB family protein [candidate division KSB3 bacterium]MBD3326431.1 peptidoglycan bridge formation glycyltransferase FemA/FemB family protein [candidate division KSB3 bacterium]